MGRGRVPWVLYALALPAALTVVGRIEEHFHIGDLLAQIAIHWRSFFRTIWGDLFAAFQLEVTATASDMLTFAALIAGTQLASSFAKFAPQRERADQHVEKQADLDRLLERRQRERQVSFLSALIVFIVFFYGALSAFLESLVSSDLVIFGVGIGQLIALSLILVAGFMAMLADLVVPWKRVPRDAYGRALYFAPMVVSSMLALIALGTVTTLLVIYDLSIAPEGTAGLVWVAAICMAIASAVSVALHSAALPRILVVVLALGASSAVIELVTPAIEYLQQVLERASG